MRAVTSWLHISTCRLRTKVKTHSLVVASYDIVRNDGEFFRCVSFLVNLFSLDFAPSSMCTFISIPDQLTGITAFSMRGTSSRTGKLRYHLSMLLGVADKPVVDDPPLSPQLAKVIKQLKVAHRLILSGTPIQVRNGSGVHDQGLEHSSIHSFVCSFHHHFTHQCVHPSIHSSTHSFIHLFLPSFLHPSMHSSIHSTTHPFIHSSVPFIILRLINASIHPSIRSSIYLFIRASPHAWPVCLFVE